MDANCKCLNCGETFISLDLSDESLMVEICTQCGQTGTIYSLETVFFLTNNISIIDYHTSFACYQESKLH